MSASTSRLQRSHEVIAWKALGLTRQPLRPVRDGHEKPASHAHPAPASQARHARTYAHGVIQSCMPGGQTRMDQCQRTLTMLHTSRPDTHGHIRMESCNVGQSDNRAEDLAMVDIGVQCSLEQILEVGFYHRCRPLSSGFRVSGFKTLKFESGAQAESFQLF